jgi:hypothetical protein
MTKKAYKDKIQHFNKMVKNKANKIAKKYSNGIIYNIKNKINNKNYIGSTTATKEKRFREHKYASESKIIHKHTNFIKAIQEFGIDNFEISIIEKWPCDNVWQLTKREGYHQVLNNTVKNGYNDEYANLPIFVRKLKNKIWQAEWHQNQKKTNNEYNEKRKMSSKKWIENNKEKFIETKRKYIKKISEGENRDKYLQQKRESYEKNKDKHNEIIKCDCGGTYQKKAKNRHFKTKKHQEYEKCKQIK